MSRFLEYLKRFPKIKKIGRKMLMVKECYYRLIADEDFYREYQKKFLELPSCRDGKQSLFLQYSTGNLRLIDRPLQKYCDELWDTIVNKIAKKESYAVMRVGDGEANFLNGVVRGNTATRHFTTGKQPGGDYLEQFKKGLLLCDSIHIEMYKSGGRSFRGIYGGDIFSPIPLECIYALMANGKILKSKYKIGIIGADNKIEIIKKLLQHEEYCSYIGRDTFEDYITIPERGSSNNVNELFENIVGQLNPSIDIYLVGIGVAKMAILGKLKEQSNTVFIDVGCGISALAGLVSNDRPYFADWVNFRLKDFDYSKIDVMDAEMGKGGIVYV